MSPFTHNNNEWMNGANPVLVTIIKQQPIQNAVQDNNYKSMWALSIFFSIFQLYNISEAESFSINGREVRRRPTQMDPLERANLRNRHIQHYKRGTCKVASSELLTKQTMRK
jgi:hypothetical protein